MLEGREIAIRRGSRRIPDALSLCVEPGRITGLLGPNGAGKSTTIRILAGDERRVEGRVLVDGRDVTRLPLWRRVRLGLAYLPQEPTVFPELTVEENLLAATPDDPRRAGEAMALAGLEGLRDRQAGRLSGGERRRVELARTLALPGAKYLLLDEPFAALDPVTVSRIKRMVLATARERGLGVLLADHSVRDVMSVADRCILLVEGRVVAEGPPRVLARDPAARTLYLGPDFVAPRKLAYRPE